MIAALLSAAVSALSHAAQAAAAYHGLAGLPYSRVLNGVAYASWALTAVAVLLAALVLI